MLALAFRAVRLDDEANRGVVLANGKPKDVVKSVTELLDSLEDKTRVILSCGGGLPPGVSTAKLKAFIETVKNSTPK